MLSGQLLVLLIFLVAVQSGPLQRSDDEANYAPGKIFVRADSTTLSPDAVQSGSFVDGSQQIGADEANQAKSETSTNNFINYCSGKELTNGLQITTGSCNGIPMGDIPAKASMVSAIILFPETGSATIASDTTFNISVLVSNMALGSFTNADATYYGAPQALKDGLVVGHTHVVIQDMGASLNPTAPLDPTIFASFKGINDAGNGQGLLSATVSGGLPAGHYRICTINSASNHQSVLMPVAQRGTADDCSKFTVIGSGNTENAAANDGSKGIAAAALAASAVAAGAGFVAEMSTSITASSLNGESATPTSGSDETLCTLATSTVTVDPTPASTTSLTSKLGLSATSTVSLSTTQSATSTFTSSKSDSSALGGISAPAILDSGDVSRPFSVDGNTFVNKSAAIQRSCDIQFNLCANAVNGNKLTDVTLADCSGQQTTCTSQT